MTARKPTKKARKYPKYCPAAARTFDAICRLKRDGDHTPSHWLQLDVGEVTIATQRSGKPSTEMVTMSRRTFERFAEWYYKPQKPHPPRREKGAKREVTGRRAKVND